MPASPGWLFLLVTTVFMVMLWAYSVTVTHLLVWGPTPPSLYRSSFCFALFFLWGNS